MTRQEPPARGETPPASHSRQRIAKLMARVGLCSRRDAEAWIVDGRVSVNGTVLTSPALDVGPEDAILVDGVPLPGVEKTRLFLFHKPRGLVTSDHDPEGRETVADYLREHWPEGPRVVTIGRLDINTEGLLLLTNDGGLARILELPKTGWLRRYRVRAKGTANVAALDALAAGITIDGVDYAGIEAKLDRVQGANSWLTMGLREGKNREIKRVLEHLGLEVNRLIRLSFGPFQLQDLPEGAVEEVRPRVLRDQLGENLAAEAGIDLDAILPEPPPRARVESRDGERQASRPERAKAPRPPPERMRRPPSDRPARPRRDDRDEAPTPLRDRPVSGTRKHVSTLRRAETDDARQGPRKRIERTATQDRRDRTIKVERLVSARPTPDRPPARTRSRDASADRRPPRGDDRFSRGDDRKPRPGNRDVARRDDRPRTRHGDDAPASRRTAAFGDREREPKRRPDRPEGDRTRRFEAGADRRPSRGADDRTGSRKPPRSDHASPSALGKRERMARSGARPDRSDRRDDERSSRRARDEAPPRRADRSGDKPERPARRPDTDKREKRPGPERASGRRDQGGERRPHADARPRPRSEDGRKPRPAGKPAGRPMGAASRKPGNRTSPASGGPSAHRGRPPRGPSKPKR